MGKEGKWGADYHFVYRCGIWFNKANPKKPYADALELAESMAKDVEGEIIYCIDDEKIKKSKLKGMSTKNIRSVSVNEMDGTKIVRLETENIVLIGFL